MSGLRKTFFKTSKILDSTFRDNKKYYDEDYVQQDRNFENLRKVMQELKLLFEKTIEPRSKARSRITGNARKQVTKESKECAVEVTLEDFIYKNSPFVEAPTRDALACLEKFYHRIADARERLETTYVDNIKNSFKDSVEAPSEEIKFMAKKVEGKRIELEALKADKKVPPGDIATAQEAFDDIRIHRQNLMIDFTQNSHKEYIILLSDYMELWSSFFQECSGAAKNAHTALLDMYKHSLNKPLVPHLKSGNRNMISNPSPAREDSAHYYEPAETPTTNSSFDFAQSIRGEDISVSNGNPFAPQAVSGSSFGGRTSSAMAEVLFDFEAEADEELTCYAGNSVVIIERIDENWYNCSLNGKSGFVPVNYLKLLK